MRIGVDTESMHLWFQNRKIDIFGFIDMAEEMGFDGVMINTLSKKNQREGLGALGEDSLENVRRVSRYLKEKGMFVELATKGTDPAHLSHMIEIAAIMGADVLRTYIAYPGGTPDGMQNGTFNIRYFRLAVAELQEVVPLLALHHIHLAVENHEMETCYEIRAIVDAVHSPWVGVHFDIGNTMMAWEDPEEGLREILPVIKSTHIKDHVVCRESGHDIICGVPLGKGNIPIDHILQVLAEETELDHVIVEMCYPYACPFRRTCGAGGTLEVGKGAFALRELPIPQSKVSPENYYLYQGIYLQEMLRLQYNGLRESMEYMKKWQKQSSM